MKHGTSKHGTPDPDAQAQAEEAGIWCMRLSEGQLDADGQAAFEAWLGDDGANRAAFDRAVALWRELGAAEDSPEFLPLRVHALNGLRRAQRRRWAWRPRLHAAAAAAVLVVATAGVFWHLQAPDVYVTGVGERRVVALEDGSQLSLDAATRVEVRYDDDRRELRLQRGRARFAVAKDPLRPFSVIAGNRVVVAVGTAFSVELVNAQVRVVLYEGRVSVLGRASERARAEPLHLPGRATPAEQVLTPGRELVASLQAPVARVAAVDPVRSRSWESGQLVFADEPLAAAVERINRYTHRKLEIGDADAGRLRINGVFDAGDTEGFVEGITAVFPVRADLRDGRTVLHSRR